jgi:hypothetical protein
MLFMEMIAVYSENNTNPINVLKIIAGGTYS